MPRIYAPTATLTAALTLALCLLLPCLGPAALAAGPAPCPPARTIEVEGVGEVALAPTVGRANLQVEANAPSAAKALEKVSAATSHVMAALKPKLAAADRLTTAAYDLFPLYEQEDGQATLTGYRATARLALEVSGPKRLGELLDAAVSSGATGVSGVDFDNPKADEARRDAAAAALKAARALAERLAAEAGVKLGRLLSLSTSPQPAPGPLRYRAALAAEAAPPIEPGELKVRASVSAVYEIGEK